jgi:carboxypeptidase T
MKRILLLFAVTVGLIGFYKPANSNSNKLFWIKVTAKDKFARSVIVNTGASVEIVRDGFVVAVGGDAELNRLEKLGWVESYHEINDALDFPAEDQVYHNYSELVTELNNIHNEFPDITSLYSIGKSIEGRDILALRISSNLDKASQKPGIIFMGGHHAREHLSVETPLLLVKRLLSEYKNQNAMAMNIIEYRDLHIIPAVNPDGMEYDIAANKYKYWRKNRAKNNNGTYGVDLNRNYGYQWGTGGSSQDQGSDIYMGPKPFSEPETQAIKNYVEKNTNLSILLSFHTFSKLILYPWGHKYDAVTDAKDRAVFETMGRKMASWNGYEPQQASALYIASGDTCDWAYGEHKIFAFTFELDPANDGWGGAGFYPGAGIISEVIDKNYQPFLYLIGLADNPYRAIQKGPIGSSY